MLKQIVLLSVIGLGFVACSDHGDQGYVSTEPIVEVPFTGVHLTDYFWAPRIEVNRTVSIPSAFRSMSMGSSPRILTRRPSSVNSPRQAQFSHIHSFLKRSFPPALKMLRATGRSKCVPSFFRSAGDRFTVTRSCGNGKPELLTAALTRSFDSLIAASASPTI